MTQTITAKDGRDMQALIAVRKALEAGAEKVVVAFPGLRVFRQPVTYTQADLPALYQKITFSM